MPGPSVLGFWFDDGVKIALTPLDNSSTCSVVKVLSIIILYHVAATLYALDGLLLLSHFPKQQRLVEIILTQWLSFLSSQNLLSLYCFTRKFLYDSIISPYYSKFIFSCTLHIF